MKFKDQYQFVSQNIKKNKIRVFMTVLATAIGCAFLIVLASVGFGLHDSILKETMEDRAVTEVQVHGRETDGNYQPLTDEDIDFFESLEGVKAVTRNKQLYQTPTYKLEDYQAQSNTLVSHFPSEVKAGLELSEGRLPEKENEVIVGYNFRSNLLLSDVNQEELYNDQDEPKDKYLYQDSLIGKVMDMEVIQINDNQEETKSISLKIVGVTEKPGREWEEDRSVYISNSVLKEVEEFTGTARGMVDSPGGEQQGPELEIGAYDQVTIYATSIETVKQVSEQLETENYASYSVISEMEQINILFTIMKAGLILIGTIAVLIASIGIYNTMTMAVTERAPDIGIMKAIGAKPKIIKRIFVLESSLIGLAGAVIGTIVAYVISFAVNIGLPLIIESAFNEELPPGLKFSMIPWTLVLIAVGICLVVTILSGLRPAKRATQIDVLKAMRREV
ncbi:ABC transporter permease [Sediminibacillus albus]|uniref:Acetoin utilization transport system permease protein n=1 Tax=Sediminibacillus albus TaxID=407036 RepID=A0A1G9AT47_9BACI|nr:ABC transporter permease [Sediminibacillus albus]SDK30441.1 acetoin utilization transport system permease protein [Sediminibacillus albus]